MSEIVAPMVFCMISVLIGIGVGWHFGCKLMNIVWRTLHATGIVTAVRAYDLDGYSTILRCGMTPNGRQVAWWLGTALTLHADGRLGGGFYSWDRWERL